VDEPTDPQPPPNRRRPATTCRLAPAQEAWGEYVSHATRCPSCRDVDSQCQVAEGLWRAWRERSAAALEEIGLT
jgi:hypothetical protein